MGPASPAELRSCRASEQPPTHFGGCLLVTPGSHPRGKITALRKGVPGGQVGHDAPPAADAALGRQSSAGRGACPPQPSDGAGRGDCVRPPRDCGTTPSPPGATGAHDSRGGEGGGHETWRNGAPWWPWASARLWMRNRWHPRAVAMGLPWILSPLLPWRKEEAGSGGAAARATRTSPRPRTEELGARQGSDSISCPS